MRCGGAVDDRTVPRCVRRARAAGRGERHPERAAARRPPRRAPHLWPLNSCVSALRVRRTSKPYGGAHPGGADAAGRDVVWRPSGKAPSSAGSSLPSTVSVSSKARTSRSISLRFSSSSLGCVPRRRGNVSRDGHRSRRRAGHSGQRTGRDRWLAGEGDALTDPRTEPRVRTARLRAT